MERDDLDIRLGYNRRYFTQAVPNDVPSEMFSLTGNINWFQLVNRGPEQA